MRRSERQWWLCMPSGKLKASGKVRGKGKTDKQNVSGGCACRLAGSTPMVKWGNSADKRTSVVAVHAI